MNNLLCSKPCPFGLGLRKFALDPVVVNFFENALDPTLVIFLTFFEKITTIGSSLFISPNGQGYDYRQLV